MTFEFKTLEIKSPTGILWLVIASGLTIMGTILLFVTTDNLILRVSVSAPMTLALPLTLMYMLTSKVKFEDDKVVKTSIFGSTELRFENINSFGVLSQS